MKVSVVLISYNQEKFIHQAVESILMQRFIGEIEVIVADDCSADNTYNIIKSFGDTSSFKFVYLNNSQNLGIKKNYQRAFAACKGDYIAVLEGDDYWCNPYRLQKHADFLDEHRECVMSWNQYILLDQSTGLLDSPVTDSIKFRYKSFNDLLLFNWVGKYSSCFYRKSIYDKINPLLYDVDVEVPDEWLLGLEMTKFGLAALLTDCMTIYRKNSGVWGKLSEQQMIDKILERISVYDEYFNFKYTTAFIIHKKRILNELKGKREAELRLKLPPIILYVRILLNSIWRIIKWFVLLFIPVGFKRSLKARLNKL